MSGSAARAAFAGLSLLTFGLWFGGATSRVHALVRAAASSPRIEVIEGSRVLSTRSVVLDGQPASIRRCLAPSTVSLPVVREAYEEIARREGHVIGPDDLPYIAVDQPDSAYVLWTCAADGHRKGMIATRSAGVIEYVLLDAEASAEGTRPGGVVLPGGASAPSGARGGLTIEEGGSSLTFFEAPGTPRDVAGALQASLGEAGYAVDPTEATTLNGVRAPRGEATRVVVPFKGKDRKGFLVVAPAGRGTSRATVIVR